MIFIHSSFGAFLLCIVFSTTFSSKVRKVHFHYPIDLLHPIVGNSFTGTVSTDKLMCFGNRDCPPPSILESIQCLIPMNPFQKTCSSLWGSRTVFIEVLGSIEILKLSKLPPESSEKNELVPINATRWMELTLLSRNTTFREIKQIPAEPIYLCVRSSDWRGRDSTFYMQFKQVYVRDRDRRKCNQKMLVHIFLLMALSSIWLIPYLAALATAILSYIHGMKYYIALLTISCCVVCLVPFMLTKKNRHLARLYLHYFFTRSQAEESRQMIRERLPLFQALFFSSSLMCLGSAGTYFVYNYCGVDREWRNALFKITIAISSGWLIFFLCRSFERFCRDWMWVAMSLGLTLIFETHLNPLSREKVIVAILCTSQIIKLCVPVSLLGKVGKLSSFTKNTIENVTQMKLLRSLLGIKHRSRSSSIASNPSLSPHLHAPNHCSVKYPSNHSSVNQSVPSSSHRASRYSIKQRNKSTSSQAVGLHLSQDGEGVGGQVKFLSSDAIELDHLHSLGDESPSATESDGLIFERSSGNEQDDEADGDFEDEDDGLIDEGQRIGSRSNSLETTPMLEPNESSETAAQPELLHDWKGAASIVSNSPEVTSQSSYPRVVGSIHLPLSVLGPVWMAVPTNQPYELNNHQADYRMEELFFPMATLDSILLQNIQRVMEMIYLAPSASESPSVGSCVKINSLPSREEYLVVIGTISFVGSQVANDFIRWVTPFHNQQHQIDGTKESDQTTSSREEAGLEANSIVELLRASLMPRISRGHFIIRCSKSSSSAQVVLQLSINNQSTQAGSPVQGNRAVKVFEIGCECLQHTVDHLKTSHLRWNGSIIAAVVSSSTLEERCPDRHRWIMSHSNWVESSLTLDWQLVASLCCLSLINMQSKVDVIAFTTRLFHETNKPTWNKYLRKVLRALTSCVMINGVEVEEVTLDDMVHCCSLQIEPPSRPSDEGIQFITQLPIGLTDGLTCSLLPKVVGKAFDSYHDGQTCADDVSMMTYLMVVLIPFSFISYVIHSKSIP